MARIIKDGNRYYDTGTANKSFLQVANDLRILGVEKWYFMLEIKNPALIHVDPYKCDNEGHSTCTQHEVEMITNECRFNLWYYLREIARIPEAGSANGIPYKANRGNIAQAWCLLNGIDSWLCLPRQTCCRNTGYVPVGQTDLTAGKS